MYKNLVEKFRTFYVLKDLKVDTKDNANVNRVRLGVARAEIYRNEIGLDDSISSSKNKNKSLTAKSQQNVVDFVLQDQLPRGPLNELKIRYNDVLDRYLNQKVLRSDYSVSPNGFQ